MPIHEQFRVFSRRTLSSRCSQQPRSPTKSNCIQHAPRSFTMRSMYSRFFRDSARYWDSNPGIDCLKKERKTARASSGIFVQWSEPARAFFILQQTGFCISRQHTLRKLSLLVQCLQYCVKGHLFLKHLLSLIRAETRTCLDRTNLY